MKVFISWGVANSRSHLTALLLKDWLPRVMQNVSCFVSSRDIGAGSVWANTLFDQLEQCNLGILCLTPESVTRPWLLYEAGALAKHVKNAKVCPLLIDLKGPLEYPLGAFQGRVVDKAGIKSLVEMINIEQAERALAEAALNSSFEMWWPQFEKDFSAMPPASASIGAALPENKQEKILDELLETVRGIAGGRIRVNVNSGVFTRNPRLLRSSDTVHNHLEQLSKAIRNSLGVDDSDDAVKNGERILAVIRERSTNFGTVLNYVLSHCDFCLFDQGNLRLYVEPQAWSNITNDGIETAKTVLFKNLAEELRIENVDIVRSAE